MYAADAIGSAIKRCGRQTVLVSDGKKYTFTACIMPRFYANEANVPQSQCRFGVEDARKFVYYGPVSGGGEFAEDGCIVTMGEEQYTLWACHDFYYQSQPVFRRAMAQKLMGGHGDGLV